jgi:catechol 2,3-dioxygenase-like lactoylglutathione lyase family enzyme
MIRTHGLTHINLAVPDLERSLRFYTEVFGVEEYHRDDGLDPGAGPRTPRRDRFRAGRRRRREAAEISHFGFRLVDAKDIDAAVEGAVKAGGLLLRRRDFAPGFPFAYIADPDGYEIEIWYE